MREALSIAAVVLLAAAILSGCGGDSGDASRSGTATESVNWTFPPRPIAGVEERIVGRGVGAAALLWSEGGDPPSDTVLFLHGWLALPPSTYGPWLHHLAKRGNTIVYPVYQGPQTKPEDFLENAIAGIAAGLRAVDADPASLVVVGDTVGGGLAFDYAAVAADHGLPPPRGVLAAFPGRDPPAGRVPASDLSRIPRHTTLKVIAGPGDPIPGGEAQARALLRGATDVPPSRRRFLSAPRRSGPTGDGPRSRRAFWAPLDRLITQVRTEQSGGIR